MFRYETHIHTSEASACSFSSGAETASAHKALGYDGIIITDHFFNGNTCIQDSLPWEEKIECFCKGFENAKKRGAEIGLKVFFGWEYCLPGGTEFLTYGLDKQWLLAHPEIIDINITEYAELVKSDGGFLVHAHPFREARWIKRIVLLPEIPDAVETFNCRHDPLFDERAKWYAESYGFPQTAGSDIHCAEEVSGTGVLSPVPFETVFDYINAVRDGKIITAGY